MAGLEVVPFSDEHLDDAARLLAARQARHREVEPALPERFEDPAAAREEIEQAWRVEGASGTAALREGRVVGYLIGTPREPKTWGENVWVELAGHAVEEPEDIRDLYAEAAARWVEEGRARHYALVPADDSGRVDAWFRLGFGQQHAHGLQEVAPREVALPPGIEIREPREDEIEELIEIDLALPAHQGRSPVFSSIGQPTRAELREEWASTLAGDEEHVLVAYQDGKPVAVWSVSSLEVSSQHRGLGRPKRAAFLGFASTLPEFRGTGLGLALTDASFAWAAENGYEVMVTDWRVTNLLSSRFWTKRGFRPIFLRLYRSIP
ncbi:MAG: GNAT family N-acetyltransferase [Actinomycetota bacterium]|nr:GNAT family N-acetyltransferase [Actinomycetota bacterium]